MHLTRKDRTAVRARKRYRGVVILATCEHTPICPFFISQVGYSPELYMTMKDKFCLGDNAGCARLLALDVVERVEDVPDDLIPSDHERLGTLRREVYGDESK